MRGYRGRDMKKILLISYYYPPFRGVGAKRIYSLSKLLSKNGHKVIVVKASDDGYGEEVDESLAGMDKNIQTISVNAKNNLVHNLFVNYLKFRKVVKDLITQDDIFLLILCGGPFYYFPIGKCINLKYSIPYILDYRDNLFIKSQNIFDELYKLVFKFFWDKPSLKYASYIINVTNQLTNLHRLENPQIEEKKFITIFNGYDDSYSFKRKSESVQKEGEESKEWDVLKVGIFGKFCYYESKDVEVLLSSLDNKAFKVEIFQIGEEEKNFIEMVLKDGKEKNFKFLGYMNYEKGLQVLQEMDCFMLNSREPYELGTKIFDYIYLNKPIIAFTTPESEISGLLGSFDNSFLVFDEKENIADIFEKIYLLKEKVLDKNIKNIAKYSRSYQFEKLLNNIKKII